MQPSSHTTPDYFVPGGSRHPMFASFGFIALGFGASGWVNGWSIGMPLTLIGIAWVCFVFYQWFGESIKESESGLYSKQIDKSFRWSMSWFIFSEIMFFASLFASLWYARAVATPWLGDLDHRTFLWPTFQSVWPSAGPGGVVDAFETVGPWPLPTINTLLLLTSGVTLTLSHHAIISNDRKKSIFWLFLTVALGVVFLFLQASEYMHAYSELNLKFNSGIYGSLFYMLTGFHGLHVLLGAIMLAVVLFRMIRGDFTHERHFAFEGAAWYWHFVDVVWLGLYILVYWL
jgi:cytochrome c oxidase subunit 3